MLIHYTEILNLSFERLITDLADIFTFVAVRKFVFRQSTGIVEKLCDSLWNNYSVNLNG